MTDQNIATLSDEVIAEIDRWVAKYPEGKQRSAVMQALMIVQEDNGGWLTQPLMNAVAKHLHMPPVAVLEIATFYTMYEHKPVNENMVYICTNVSCQLKGAMDVADHIEKRCKTKMGGNSPCGKFTLREVECLGACVDAPIVQINKKFYENVSTENVDKILDEYE